jgi:Ice-binding-like/Bacterial Ig-like domain
MSRFESVTNPLRWLMALLLVAFVAGCGGGNGTATSTDTTAPTVISTLPANAAIGIAINSNITVTFSEAMNSSTITTTTFTLKQQGSTTSIPGAVTYAGTTATFNPTSSLTASTTYTATVTAGVKDLAGNPLASAKTWSFTTGTTADTTAPTVSSTDPANAATGVATGGNIAVAFSEAMDPSTITAASFTLMQGTTSVSGAVTYAGTTATFNPTSSLIASTTYTATVTAGVKDLAGNPLASAKTWSFTTGTTADTTAPTLTGTINANGATNVAINTKVGATFSEAMDPSTITNLTLTLKEKVSGTAVAGTVNYSGVNAVFIPLSNLTNSTVYTFTVKGGVNGAKDLAGNALASDFVVSWTTGAALDTTAPTVTPLNPADLARGVAQNTKVSATFSEAMDPLTVTTATFLVTGPGVSPISGTVTYVGRIATFTPSSDLASNITYTATVTTGTKDLAGNALAANDSWSFTTALVVVPPSLPANPTAPVLGETGRFVILASQKVTTTSGSAISNGDIGIEDQARSYYAGFTAGASPGQFTELTNGLSYAHDDINPALIPAPYASTIAFINQVRTDLGNAYSFLAADPNPGAPTQVCPTELGGLTLTRGVYKTAGNVAISTGTLHLDAQGDPNSVFIFTIEGTLTTGAPGGSISLDNGALAKNVYFRTGGFTVIGAGTAFYGNVFAWSQVNVLAGAKITGRLFGLTDQVTLISDAVTKAP